MGSPFASKTRRNPIHGMSMALHSSFSSNEIPPAASLREKASKVGHLKKLSGKGILTSGTWRDRFCLLVKTKLYFYENEKSEGTEKSCGFVNLEYFDTCTEATTRMARKATNVFVIGSTEKGFFESHSGRHYFAAETVTEMKEWVNAINTAMHQIRGKEKRTRDGSLTPAPPGLIKKDPLNVKSKAKEDENGTLPRSGDRLDHVTKSRVKGPQGRRLPRKSHLGRASGISESRPEAVDSLVDSDEEVRDSRGRATSLSALEASSVTHPNTKQHQQSNSSGQETEDIKLGRGNRKENFDSWSNASADSDMVECQEMDLVYKYSSSEDSDEENRVPLSKTGKGNFNRSPLGSSTYIQKRGSGRGSSMYRGGTPLRNSSVTPPPCILRKFRREQIGNFTGNNLSKSKNGKENDRSNSPVLLPGIEAKPQRTSSGSSLSTLTADTYVSNNMTLMGSYGRQHSFSSLQRPSRKNSSGNNGPGCASHRNVSSANASPLLGNNSYLQNGHRSINGNSSPYGTHSPSGTFERNAGSAARAFHLERSMHTVSKELEKVSQDTKQIDTEIQSMKDDVGNVQENLATVRGYVDTTKDRVTKLQSQVGTIEKQVASSIKEAQTMRDQAKKLLELAENSKVTHDNLMEEAEHLVSFLRQSASCMPGPYHHHTHNHGRPQYPPSCCSGNSGSQYYSTLNNGGTPPAQHHGPVTSLRKKSKTPDRSLLDSDPEMELLDETQTQMENIIAKHRKSKALLSASSSSGSGSSGHVLSLASNRNSMIEIGENGHRSLNNNRSPKADGRT